MRRNPLNIRTSLSGWVQELRDSREQYAWKMTADEWRVFLIYIENLEKSLAQASERAQRYKEAVYPATYGGSTLVMARADYAVTLMKASEHESNPYKYWVDVVKNRSGNTSRHAFLTLDDALDFMKGFLG